MTNSFEVKQALVEMSMQLLIEASQQLSAATMESAFIAAGTAIGLKQAADILINKAQEINIEIVRFLNQ